MRATSLDADLTTTQCVKPRLFQWAGKEFPEDIKHYYVEPVKARQRAEKVIDEKRYPVTLLQYETMQFIKKWQKMGGAAPNKIVLRVPSCYQILVKRQEQGAGGFKQFVLWPLRAKGMIENSKLYGMDHKFVLTKKGLLHLKYVAKPED